MNAVEPEHVSAGAEQRAGVTPRQQLQLSRSRYIGHRCGPAKPLPEPSVHYARAELVTLAAGDGAPRFVDRRRITLIGDGLPSAPYHHEALEWDIGEATALVNRVRRSVAEHAGAAISTMLVKCRARVLILPASPYDRLPSRWKRS